MRHVGVGALAAGMLLALGLAPARADSMAANMNPGLCIDWNTGNNAVGLWQCHGGYNQNFFTAMAMSQPRYGNLCLDQAALSAGAPLVMTPCANKPTQTWQMVANPNDPSYGRYRNAAGYCANIPNGNAQQGTPVIAWPCQTGPAPNDIWLPRIAQASIAPNPQGPVAQQPFVQPPVQQGPQAQQPPPPPPPPGQPVPPIDRSPAQLEAMGEIGDVVNQGLSVVGDLQAFANALRANSTGPTPLWDPQYIATLDAAINYAGTMIAGPNNPYSLQKLAAGSVVAMNEEERREFNILFAKFGMREQFRRIHAAYSPRATMAAPAASGRAWLPPASGRLGRPPLILVQGGDGRTVAALSKQIVPRMDGYDRAQQLATSLNFMRTANIVRIFADYQLLAESTASAYVERLIGKIETSATGGAAQSAATTKLLRILKA